MHEHESTHVLVSRRALRVRITRALAREGRKLVHRRDRGWFLLDLASERVLKHYPTEPDWVQWAEDAGVLQPWETVEVGA